MLGRSVVSRVALSCCAWLGCSSGGGGGNPQDDPDWLRISGDTHIVCDPGTACTWQSVGDGLINDFAFDGEDILVSMSDVGGLRLALATGTGMRVDSFTRGVNSQIEVVSAGVFVKGNVNAAVWMFDRAGNNAGLWSAVTVDTTYDVSLRLSPEGHVLTGGQLVADGSKTGLVDIDPAVPGAVTEIGLPGWRPDGTRRFAPDDQGRIYFDAEPPDLVTPTLGILDRVTGVTATVTYSTIPPGSTDTSFHAFDEGAGLWGPAPGGGVLAVRQTTSGADIVRLTAAGEVSFVVHADRPAGALNRLRVRDGYLYAGGFGIWRTRRPLF